MTANALSSELEPFMDRMLHPVTRVGALRFKLTMYEELQKQFNHASAGDHAMTVHGAYRAGKTTFMKYLIRHFEHTGKMQVYSSFLEEGDFEGRDSAGGMPRLARQLRTSKVGDVPLRAGSEVEALVRVIKVEVEKTGVRRVSFLIDEAHYLSLKQLIGLKALLELLSRDDIVPFAVLFAQPEIMALRQRLLSLGQGSLVDRFFLNMHRLRGVSQNEIIDVLREYDVQQWPEEGGPTYTQFFMPAAWEQGFKLAAHGLKFARAFNLVCGRFKRDADDIPIKYVTHAVSGFLRAGTNAIATGRDLSELITDCVERSGIVESFESGNLEKLAHQGKTRAKRVAA